MTANEYRQAIDTLPYGKRLPDAVYLLDPVEDSIIPSLLRITVAELRKRLEIGPEFNLLKFHTASPKISFLAYPNFEKDPHPTLAESVIVDLVNGKTRRDDYRDFEKSPLPELLTRIKIDLKRLFVTVIDHTTGPEQDASSTRDSGKYLMTSLRQCSASSGGQFNFVTCVRLVSSRMQFDQTAV